MTTSPLPRVPRALLRAAGMPVVVLRAGASTAVGLAGAAAGGVARRVARRVDLTPLITEVVDLDALITAVDLDAVARRIDVEAVAGRLDLAALVETVLEEIDLPEIIRSSTGSVASSTVRGLRMQSILADEAVTRAYDRLRGRRSRPGPTPTPRGDPAGAAGAS